jgi:hypothetical protein
MQVHTNAVRGAHLPYRPFLAILKDSARYSQAALWEDTEYNLPCVRVDIFYPVNAIARGVGLPGTTIYWELQGDGLESPQHLWLKHRLARWRRTRIQGNKGALAALS